MDSRAQYPEESNYLDILSPESHPYLYGELPNFTGKVIETNRAEARHNNPIWVWTTYFYYPLISQSTSPHDLKLNMRNAIIHNASPIVNLFMKLLLVTPWMDAIREIFNETKKTESI